MPVVKICGVRTVEAARAATEAGAEMVGLVFAASRRRVAADEARAMTAAAYATRPLFVGVFVNEAPETINAIAEAVGLDLVQLSGDEEPASCALLTRPYLKVVHAGTTSTAGDIALRAGRYADARAIVLDAGGDGVWGGTGTAVNVDLAATVVRRLACPVMLAGGLTPESVASIVGYVGPWGVDVSSGVETAGEKDIQKIARFVTAARGAERATI